jgi:hypothetical protein
MLLELALGLWAKDQNTESGRLIGDQQPKPGAHIDMDGVRQKLVYVLASSSLEKAMGHLGDLNRIKAHPADEGRPVARSSAAALCKCAAFR